VPINSYTFKLADSPSLNRIAQSGEYRVIDDIQNALTSHTQHTEWLKSQGYNSSFTVPMYDNDAFIGLIFYNSFEIAAFTPKVQCDLGIYSNLINMSVSSELSAVRTILASAQMARDFANFRDFETGAHLDRMAQYSQLIAKSTAPHYHLSDDFIENVLRFSPLHDIGKIGIPDTILHKPGRLNEDERKIMQTHVIKGSGIIDKILNDFALNSFPDSIIMRNIVEFHHEFLDGSGYPKGLVGDNIPIEARIVTVADIFDALTSKRPYKNAWTMNDALNELERMAEAGKLDRVCVEAVKSNLDEFN
jgi:HD-GYP domain-containing protein (c-di-GMP phosphodiesterase class II)